MSENHSHGADPADPADLAQGIAEAVALRNSCLSLLEKGEYDRAEPILAESVAMLRSLAALDPHAVGPQLGLGLKPLAALAVAGSNYGRARQLATEALPLLRQGVTERPSQYVASLSRVLWYLAESLCQVGEPEPALPLLDEAIELVDHPGFAPDPVVAALLSDVRLAVDLREVVLFRCLRTRLEALQRLHRTDEALIAALEAVDVGRLLAQRAPDRYSPLMARVLTRLALMHEQSDGPAAGAFRQESLPYWYAAAVHQRERLGPDPQAAPQMLRFALIKELMPFGLELVRLGRGPEALPSAREAVDLARALAAENPDKWQSVFETCQKHLAGLEHRPW
ncbi:hypothetical protein [Actinospica robiniae]|uniref:hypothetical protein n=1 Tax=Actinospica robiniae TaxID=304901 RepID=UPI000406D321|nr:hypothetical protein [Actinospica robiniae]